jgi:hypothetical protein
MIQFVRPNQNARGHRADYVINMVQDDDFNACVARPIETRPFNNLQDPKWKELL